MSNSSANPWTVAHQAPLSMGVSRQGYWSGLPFPSPGDLPDPGIENESPLHVSCIAGRFFTTELPRKPNVPIQMLNPSRNNLMDTPKIMINGNNWISYDYTFQGSLSVDLSIETERK